MSDDPSPPPPLGDNEARKQLINIFRQEGGETSFDAFQLRNVLKLTGDAGTDLTESMELKDAESLNENNLVSLLHSALASEGLSFSTVTQTHINYFREMFGEAAKKFASEQNKAATQDLFQL
eukprot:TRINITY_DN25794_c0_g1_i1.p1 TRINITY_DN25794_c0_g1~~TRINITY_DN25794_c0_g1_i1.p1  ORF type:complete len:142 (+),score=26.07 TRINITY_DN25794_c0_g1_i1:63-428(+)